MAAGCKINDREPAVRKGDASIRVAPDTFIIRPAVAQSTCHLLGFGSQNVARSTVFKIENARNTAHS
jgi:hypothetical protein